MDSPFLPNRLLTVDEFLALEEGAAGKQEFVAGHVFAMTGASARHNLIAGNIFRRLSTTASGGPCRVFISDVKLRAADDVIYYPDVMVFCGDLDPAALIIRDPCLVVEVTSPSTARFDKSEKRDVYLRIPSLQAYVIVEQGWRRVDRYWRGPTGDWQSEIIQEGVVPSPCPDTVLTLDEIYAGLAPLTVREMAAIGYAVE
ncbi:MAG: Uma2 family endonuclease [Gemmatimonadaceae bacterium]